jgi:hypothetical protein
VHPIETAVGAKRRVEDMVFRHRPVQPSQDPGSPM